MEADSNRFQSTAETMAVVRRGAVLRAAEQWPWDEVLAEAPTLA